MSQKPKGKSLVAKQSVVIGGRKTSITLERPFWTALKEIAAREEVSVSTLVARIDADRRHANLSSVILMTVSSVSS